jgi:hypothetical protein
LEPVHDNATEHRESDARPSLNRLAADATMHCLTGGAIGEVLGLVIAVNRFLIAQSVPDRPRHGPRQSNGAPRPLADA